MSSSSGGGAGGSINVFCEDLSGFGGFLATGGKGYNGGGGGGGGRIAIKYMEMNKFAGSFNAQGGDSTAEVGGAGTVYLEQRNGTEMVNTTLIVDNKGLKYPKSVKKSEGDLHDLLHGIYNDISGVGGVTWLIENQNHSFTHVDFRGNAHVAVLWKSQHKRIEFRVHTLTGMIIIISQ